MSLRAADSESSECTSSQMRFIDLRLVRLQVADEVPAERVAVLGVLALEILRAVLADDLDACASTSAAMSASGTYFVAATIVTPSPTSLRMRS